MSSLSDVPPVDTMHSTFMCFPAPRTMIWERQLSGRNENEHLNVYNRVSLFQAGNDKCCRLAVPFLAGQEHFDSASAGDCPLLNGEGRSKPFSKIPISSSRFKK